MNKNNAHFNHKTVRLLIVELFFKLYIRGTDAEFDVQWDMASQNLAGSLNVFHLTHD